MITRTYPENELKPFTDRLKHFGAVFKKQKRPNGGVLLRVHYSHGKGKVCTYLFQDKGSQ